MINYLLAELGGTSMFSKLDLKSRYHQVKEKELDIPKMVFRTHYRHYEFIVMLLRVMNVPVIFMNLMISFLLHI